MGDPSRPGPVRILLSQELPDDLRGRLETAVDGVEVGVAPLEQLDGAARLDALRQAHVLIGVPGRSSQALAEAFRGGQSLRLIATDVAGGGELAQAAALLHPVPHGTVITRAAGIHDAPLAEFCLLGMLAFRKNLPRLQADARAHRWPDRWPMRELRGATAVILGTGGVGGEVARLAHALGMRVIGIRRSPRPTPNFDEVLGPKELLRAAREADALVVTLPITDQTENMVDRDVIAALPPESVLVNVGRGAVVDEEALADALRRGALAGAALDVFAAEPLPPSSPLWQLDNVLISPHTAALTDSEQARFIDSVCFNLRALRDGTPLRGVIDVEAGY